SSWRDSGNFLSTCEKQRGENPSGVSEASVCFAQAGSPLVALRAPAGRRRWQQRHGREANRSGSTTREEENAGFGASIERNRSRADHSTGWTQRSAESGLGWVHQRWQVHALKCADAIQGAR